VLLATLKLSRVGETVKLYDITMTLNVGVAVVALGEFVPLDWQRIL